MLNNVRLIFFLSFSFSLSSDTDAVSENISSLLTSAVGASFSSVAKTAFSSDCKADFRICLEGCMNDCGATVLVTYPI